MQIAQKQFPFLGILYRSAPLMGTHRNHCEKLLEARNWHMSALVYG